VDAAASRYRYALEHAPSLTGDGSDLRIAVHLPTGSEPEAPIEVLSIDAWATNRALPASLGIGDVRVPAPATPHGVTFRNLRAVSSYRPAPHGDALARRVLALIALSTRPLARADSLRALIHALDLGALADVQASRALAQRLEAIVDVASRAATERFDGVQMRGHDVEMSLSEAGFDGEGEAFVFASVLAAALSHEASLSSFVRARARLTTTGRTFVFAARNGDQERE
jgi:type VI secretion system protein ImpG